MDDQRVQAVGPQSDPAQAGRRIALVSVVVNVLLSVGNITIGLLAGSTSATAAGVGFGADVVAAGLVYAGLYIAAQPPDQNHPYGHGRAEILAGLILGLVLLLTGIGILIAQVGMQQIWTLILPLPLVIAGVAVSLWWRQLLIKNKALVGLRMKVLREMENDLPGSVRMYHREDALYPVDEQGKPIPGKGLNQVDLEIRLPWLFLFLYTVFGAGLLAAWLTQIM